MTQKLVWEDPPPIKRGRASQVEIILEVLRSKPGKWARVKESTSHTYLQNLRRSILAAGGDDYEATERGDALYARFVGEEEK